MVRCIEQQLKFSLGLKTMDKIDLKKSLDSYKAKLHLIQQITIPTMQYLMVDGHGDPNTSKQFTDAINALYTLAYTIKFASKKELGKDYVVMPLEGLWWAEDMSTFTTNRDKSQWNFTLMIMQPDWITKELFDTAVAKVREKNPPQLLEEVRFETLEEGLVVQTLHVGSFDDESAMLVEIHNKYIPESSLKMSGKHHEIYLSDFRKVAPDKLKTILRQPVIPS